jgi:hypothetical protein
MSSPVFPKGLCRVSEFLRHLLSFLNKNFLKNGDSKPLF